MAQKRQRPSKESKKGFNEEIQYIISVFLAYSTYFDIVKTGRNQKYNFCTDTFDLRVPKWVGLIEKMSPIDFYRGNFSPLCEADYC